MEKDNNNDNTNMSVDNNFDIYKIDFDKVETIEDVKTIIKGLNITISDRYEGFDGMKHLLKKVD